VEMKSFSILGIVLCLLAGCASDPMKPHRPSGRRVPVNTTPLPVSSPIPADHVETMETIMPVQESNDG